jgi:CheY-like chemotaxis protein
MMGLLRLSVARHATLETALRDDVPEVLANAAQIRQIVMNLVMNSSEAMGNGEGRIRVATTWGNRPSILARTSIETLAEGDYVQLEVADNGIGMSDETQSRMFDPFFTTKSAGHGLGLAVVQGIVRGLGGGIHVRSEVGKGTAIKVFLPCIRVTAGTVAEPLSHAASAAALKITVLVVEDELPLRQAVVKLLRKAGFQVREAADGSAALDLLRSRGAEIDVVLLDMTIPGASSREVAAEAAVAWPNMKLVLTSAYSQEMLSPLITGSQVRAFVRKPYRVAELSETLRNAVKPIVAASESCPSNSRI